MTTTADSLYGDALFAIASYANLDGSTPFAIALAGADLAARQVADFAENYSVVTYYSDPATSFAATVFTDAVGNLTLAFRGSNEFGDFVPNNVTTVSDGAAYDQIVAMYNWWRRASAPPGSLVDQYRVVPDSESQPLPPGSVRILLYSFAGELYYLESAPPADATGEIWDALPDDADQRLNVVGHSLGGHLALAFNALFSSAVDRVTIFNAPGITDTSTNQEFFAALGGSTPTDATSGNVTRVIADESAVGGTPGVIGAATLNWPANSTVAKVYVPIEDQTLSDEPNPFISLLGVGFGNHSIVILTDSLAVFELVAELAPSVTLEDYKVMLSGAVRGTSASYERIVDALQALFGVDTTPLPSGNTKREELYSAIKTVRDAYPALVPPPVQLQIVPITTSAATLVNLAINGDIDALAYRYALRELNSFVVLGAPTLYYPHNQSGELDLYVSGGARVGLTEEYIADRAAMLAFAMTANNNDTSAFGSNQVTDQVRYTDAVVQTGGKTTDFLVFLPGGTPNFNGPNTRRISFGSDGADSLRGRDNNDRLYGAAGTDYLAGGEEQTTSKVVLGSTCMPMASLVECLQATTATMSSLILMARESFAIRRGKESLVRPWSVRSSPRPPSRIRRLSGAAPTENSHIRRRRMAAGEPTSL